MARVLSHISSFIAARCLSFCWPFLFNTFNLGKGIGKREKEIGKGQKLINKLIKLHTFIGFPSSSTHMTMALGPRPLPRAGRAAGTLWGRLSRHENQPGPVSRGTLDVIIIDVIIDVMMYHDDLVMYLWPHFCKHTSPFQEARVQLLQAQSFLLFKSCVGDGVEHQF